RSPVRVPRLLFLCPATKDLRCRPPILRPAASGTFRFPSLSSSACRGIPRFPLLRQPSPCRAPLCPSPPCPPRKSKIYLKSPSRTVYPHHAPAAERSCPLLPSTRQSCLPTWRRRSMPATHCPERSLSCPQENHSSSAVRELPVPPVPKVPGPQPCRTCSETPQSPALPPVAPAECVPASAASDHPSPLPPGSRRPSARLP